MLTGWTSIAHGHDGCYVIDTQTGLTAFFIAREDLIASKLAAGRTCDLADVEEIKDAEASRENTEQE